MASYRLYMFFHCCYFFLCWSNILGLGWSFKQQDDEFSNSAHFSPKESLSSITASGSESWSYRCAEVRDGPDNWADLYPEWALCKSGRKQSPVDVQKYELEEDLELGILSLTYDNAPEYSNATLVNDGRSIKVIRTGGSLIVKGVNYSLAYLEFHSPSEHTLNGVLFPLEMQVVHVSPEGTYAIIVAVFDYGEHQNPVLEQVTSQLEKLTKSEPLHGVTVNVYSKPTDTHHYYQYEGSMTRPPCTENVLWTIVSTTYKVSPTQLALFRAALKESNNRPTQPMNGRKVHVSSY